MNIPLWFGHKINLVFRLGFKHKCGMYIYNLSEWNSHSCQSKMVKKTKDRVDKYSNESLAVAWIKAKLRDMRRKKNDC